MKNTVLLLLSLTTSLVLAAIPSDATAQQLGRSTSAFSARQPFQPLTISEAFPFTVSVQAANALRISWNIADSHYLYGHQFSFGVQHGDEVQWLEFTLPEGIDKTDEFFGDVTAYYDRAAITLSLPESTPEDSVLIIEFQGCADWGFCYPPQRVEYPI